VVDSIWSSAQSRIDQGIENHNDYQHDDLPAVPAELPQHLEPKRQSNLVLNSFSLFLPF
jgi:hypothetical protein